MLVFDILFDWIGHRTARWLLPLLSFGAIRADDMLSNRIGFNWIGFKKTEDGSILCSSSMSASIGVIFWTIVLAVVLSVYVTR